MTLQEAKQLLEDKYNQAKNNPQIDDAVSWALYRTWCISKRKEKAKDKVLYQGCKWCADRHECPDAFTLVSVKCNGYYKGGE